MATATKKRPVVKKASTKAKAAPAKTTKKATKKVADEETNGDAPARRGRPRDEEAEAEILESLLESVEINGDFGVSGQPRITGIGEAAANLGIDSARAKGIIMRHLASEAGYPSDDEPATAEAIYADRMENALDWGTIEVKYGITKGQAKTLFAEVAGEGDTPTLYGFRGTDRIKPKAEPKPKSERKSAGSAKEPTPIFDGEEDKDDIIERLDGKSVKILVTVGDTSSAKKVKVSNPKVGTSKGTRVVKFTDDKGHARTVALANFVK